jgi:thymidylate kinase
MARPKVIFLEGHRLAGKSTIARHLRNKINYSTLINATGFPDKGETGFLKIQGYYRRWTDFLTSFAGSNILYLFDRYMFSEVVYSRLYKDYNFAPTFYRYLKELVAEVDVEIIFFELTDEEELIKRSMRDKVKFAEVKDDLYEVSRQRDGYRALRDEINTSDIPVTVHSYVVNGKSSKEVAEDVMVTILGK